MAVSLSEITELGLTYTPGGDRRDRVGGEGNMGWRSTWTAPASPGRWRASACRPPTLPGKPGSTCLSFGGTKNGCLAAEAVVFFNRADARDFPFARQRIGHGFSKARFIAAQFAAYLEDEHWLELARHANTRAARLADAIRISDGARLALEPAANEVVRRLLRSPSTSG